MPFTQFDTVITAQINEIIAAFQAIDIDAIDDLSTQYLRLHHYFINASHSVSGATDLLHKSWILRLSEIRPHNKTISDSTLITTYENNNNYSD